MTKSRAALLALYLAGFMGCWNAAMEYSERSHPEKSWVHRAAVSAVVTIPWPLIVTGSAAYRLADSEYRSGSAH